LELIIIAAMACNRVIGCHDTIPWHIPADMAHFQATTMGHSLIMGRKTYDSIGGPLVGRRNIVVSANPRFRPHPECMVAASLEQAICFCQDDKKVFVIGGEQLYRLALPLAETLILTVIEQEYQGDAWFPDFSELPFVLIEQRVLTTVPLVTVFTYRRTEPSAVAGSTLPG